jgi:hypothetical protein
MKAVNGGLHHQTQILLVRIFRLPGGISRFALSMKVQMGHLASLRLSTLLLRALYSGDVDRRSVQA